jgi:hypothetical protein
MPQRNSSRRLVLRLVLFTFAGWLLWALGKNSALPGTEPEIATTAVKDGHESTRTRTKASGFSKRRLATTLAFTTLFFAGAALSAGAGDLVVGALEDSTDSAATSTETAPDESGDPAAAEDGQADDPAPADDASDPAPEPAPSEDNQSGDPADDGSAPPADGKESAVEQPVDDGSAPPDAEDPPRDPTSTDYGDPAGDDGKSDGPQAGPGSPAHAGDEPQSGSDVGPTSEDNSADDLEFDNEAGYGVVWLHRTLPDPTPPAKRLAPRFARLLVSRSNASHVDWALVLGVLRAQGHTSSVPASGRELGSLASRLSALRANADEWRAALALSSRTAFADRAVALARYNRAVGLRALVRGLQAETSALEQRVLSDSRLSIYPAGRGDVASHRINVRVLVLMLYMAEAHGSVTVSSLDTGHGLYARPGVVSAHKYGLAVDIAALGGQSIVGHQQAGSITERAVRNILLLPVELRPRQVISLLGLGGPSFPLADHYDHIHVGY